MDRSAENQTDATLQMTLESEIHINNEDSDDSGEVKSENFVCDEAGPSRSCIKQVDGSNVEFSEGKEKQYDFACIVCGRFLNRSMPLHVWKKTEESIKWLCDDCNGNKCCICVQCDTAFATNRDLELHKHACKYIYICPQCGSSFERSQTLKQHLKSIHQISREAGPSRSCIKQVDGSNVEFSEGKEKQYDFACIVCGRFLNRSMPLHVWKKSEESIKWLCDDCNGNKCCICVQCDTAFATKRDLELHKHACKYICPQCGSSFERSQTLKQHLKSIHQISREAGPSRSCIKQVDGSNVEFSEGKEKQYDFACIVCGRFLNRSMPLHVWKKTEESIKWLCDDCNGNKCCICVQCDTAFATKRDLELHKHACKRYICPQCGSSFERSQTLKQHLKSIHQISQFVCQGCNKAFDVHHHLMNHIVNATCRFCRAELTCRKELKIHVQTVHPRAKDLECRNCKISFFNLSDLNAHKNSIHHNQRFTCDMCPSSYSRQRGLSVHVNVVHHGVRLTCAECNRVFAEKNSLAEHIHSVHSTLKPFACEQCDQHFAMKQSLTGEAFEKFSKYETEESWLFYI